MAITSRAIFVAFLSSWIIDRIDFLINQLYIITFVIQLSYLLGRIKLTFLIFIIHLFLILFHNLLHSLESSSLMVFVHSIFL